MKYREKTKEKKQLRSRINRDVYEALERLAILEDKSISLVTEEILRKDLSEKGILK